MEGNLNYREALAGRLKALRSGTVLDAGTGAGVMTKVLSDSLESYVVSIDVDTQVFPHVFKKVDRGRVYFVACDFTHLPFREGILDGVVCDLVISTSGEWKPLPIYGEFRRALATGSSLYVVDYYPENSPRTLGAKLANESTRLFRCVAEATRLELVQNVPPRRSIDQLMKVGFTAVREERIEAKEAEEWKRSVFTEYTNNMRMLISSLGDSGLETKFMERLMRLKSEVDKDGRITWDWGVNYLIEATK
ncbi:MAG: class I SAM-dependent methyltransferase [Candidatus Bathyarchaeota archaeon]|nr:MAG: class I SAM-dependent methyltransferase [Candidatus Bathyarchaeota archaeon]